MNLYDTKSIRCTKCKSIIGEIEFDAGVILPLCGKCANPLPEEDNVIYTTSNIQSGSSQKFLLKPKDVK